MTKIPIPQEELDLMTIDLIDNAWADFMERADRAEQYQFAVIGFFHLKLQPYFDSLRKDFNQRHAWLFMKMLKVAYEKIGWEWGGPA